MSYRVCSWLSAHSLSTSGARKLEGAVWLAQTRMCKRVNPAQLVSSLNECYVSRFTPLVNSFDPSKRVMYVDDLSAGCQCMSEATSKSNTLSNYSLRPVRLSNRSRAIYDWHPMHRMPSGSTSRTRARSMFATRSATPISDRPLVLIQTSAISVHCLCGNKFLPNEIWPILLHHKLTHVRVSRSLWWSETAVYSWLHIEV